MLSEFEINKIENLTQQIFDNAQEGELDENINNIFQLYSSIYVNVINNEGNKIRTKPKNIDNFINYVQDNNSQYLDIKTNDIKEFNFKKTLQKNIPKALNIIKNSALEEFGTIDLVNMMIIYNDEEKKKLAHYNSTVPNYANGGGGGGHRRRHKKRQTKKMGGRRRRQTKHKRH